MVRLPYYSGEVVEVVRYRVYHICIKNLWSRANARS
jgi:hypothetical protein